MTTFYIVLIILSIFLVLIIFYFVFIKKHKKSEQNEEIYNKGIPDFIRDKNITKGDFKIPDDVIIYS